MMGDVEENIGAFAYEEDVEDDFEIFNIGTSEVKETINYVPYIKTWIERVSIDIKQISKAESAFKKRGKLGPFFLFLNHSLFKCLRAWTSGVMVTWNFEGNCPTSKGKIHCLHWYGNSDVDQPIEQNRRLLVDENVSRKQ